MSTTAPTCQRLALAVAEKIAAKIVDELTPMCARIQIAGSIRRGRQSVGDIDLVLLPHPGQFGSIVARLDRNTEVITNGESNSIRILHLPKIGPVQIDCFIAHAGKRGLFDDEPSNWGSIVLCRTGSTRHNIRVVQRAKDRGLTWDYTRGILNARGQVIAGAEEADIYRVLDLPFQEPQNRELANF